MKLLNVQLHKWSYDGGMAMASPSREKTFHSPQDRAQIKSCVPLTPQFSVNHSHIYEKEI